MIIAEPNHKVTHAEIQLVISRDDVSANPRTSYIISNLIRPATHKEISCTVYAVLGKFNWKNSVSALVISESEWFM